VSGYVSGSSSYNFGSISVTPAGTAYNPFLVKYNPSTGAAIWVKSTYAGTTGTSYAYALALDSSDNIYLVGKLSNSSTVLALAAGISVSGVSNVQNGYLAKFNSSGVAQWIATVASSTANNELKYIRIDSNGNSYMAGSLNSEISYGSGVTATPAFAGANFQVVKFNSSGTPVWAKTTVTAPGISTLNGICLSGTDVLAVGRVPTTSSYDFGNGQTFTGQNATNTAILLQYGQE
jgi:hypothetical protein